ncbi:transcription factor RF2b-like [Curcuma longa]|uniref:transcription factor RF2b-like n=1 Tax=Curcuma longa TaxID=136217 RepID=UPI003D9F0B71
MQWRPPDPPQPPQSNPNFPPFSPPAAPPAPMFTGPDPTPGSHHRRARSEFAFRIPDDLDLVPGDYLAAGAADEVGSEDDLFCTFMDVEPMECKVEESGSVAEAGPNCGAWSAESSGDRKIGNPAGLASERRKHRHSVSMDGSSMMSSAHLRGEGEFGDVIEAKKAMTSEQLAELSAVDPKRAKRILANRQSAARSKERKARYITELEKKVQTLQTEATTLFAQLALFQRDTAGLSVENTELKVRLQAMEQQAQMHEALNEVLKQELEQLKFVTGEISNPSKMSNGRLHHVTYDSSFALPDQQTLHQATQFHPQFQQFQPGVSSSYFSGPHNSLSDSIGQDSTGRLQELDVSKSSFVKVEGSSNSRNGSKKA